MDMYAPIIEKVKYWREGNCYDESITYDSYRQRHDWDCMVTEGDLNADTLFSLWLPLRYSLNFYDCDRWKEWKEKEYANKTGVLKSCPEFLNDLIENIETYLLPAGPITPLLSELFDLGQERANVMLLPDRSWNKKRGQAPYWDYMPHFLYDLLSKDSPLFLQKITEQEITDWIMGWIKKEHLDMFFTDREMFFTDRTIDIDKDHIRKHIRDLAGTGDPLEHSPTRINLEVLLTNYIEILKERAKVVA